MKLEWLGIGCPPPEAVEPVKQMVTVKAAPLEELKDVVHCGGSGEAEADRGAISTGGASRQWWQSQQHRRSRQRT